MKTYCSVFAEQYETMIKEVYVMMEFLEALWNDFNNAFGKPIYLGNGENTITTLNIIVWSIFIGFFIAIIITLYNDMVSGSVVRGLLKKKAFSKENAIQASDIGCKKGVLKFSLRISSTLRKIVCTADGASSNEPNGVKLYIPQQYIKKAESLYGTKGISVKSIILAVIALFILALLALTFIPDLIQMLTNFISGLSSKS